MRMMMTLYCPLLQLLALMGIRKLMDFVFTQTELYWLDHMLPGEERIKTEDEQVSSIVSIIVD